MKFSRALLVLASVTTSTLASEETKDHTVGSSANLPLNHYLRRTEQERQVRVQVSAVSSELCTSYKPPPSCNPKANSHHIFTIFSVGFLANAWQGIVFFNNLPR
mmetsp:Transcript_29003/g.42788  ORF Transcript_29003/g.42788 Transcript_29003/m.42788 type:complete len:104 (-) Transcript_29003:2376-2687(-)